MTRRFPGPWTVEQTPGGFKVLDASGQALAYVYARDNDSDAANSKGAGHRRGETHRCEHC